MLLEILVMALVVLVYPLVLWRLNRYMEPDRMRLAEKGGMLLAREDLSKADRAMISWMLDNAYSGRVMASGILAFPIAVAFLVFKPNVRKALEEEERSRPAEIRDDFREILHLFDVSVAAANPICAAVVSAERVLFSLVAATLGKTRGALGRAKRHTLDIEVRGISFVR